MKRTFITAASLALLVGLFSFKTPKQGFYEMLNENGERVFVLEHDETMLVDGVEYTNNNPIPHIEDKYLLCPGAGVRCSGEIKTPGGVVIEYNEYKGDGKPNIEKIPDSPH